MSNFDSESQSESCSEFVLAAPSKATRADPPLTSSRFFAPTNNMAVGRSKIAGSSFRAKPRSASAKPTSFKSTGTKAVPKPVVTGTQMSSLRAYSNGTKATKSSFRRVYSQGAKPKVKY